MSVEKDRRETVCLVVGGIYPPSRRACGHLNGALGITRPTFRTFPGKILRSDYGCLAL
jgi:hypothetical protein